MKTESGATPRYQFVVCGAFAYPAGDASANRMLLLAQLATGAGHRTLVINDAAALPDDPTGGHGTHAGIDYICLETPFTGLFGRLLQRWRRPARLAAAISRNCNTGEQLIVTLPPGLYGLAAHLRLQRVLGAKVVCDVVERHDPDQFRHGRATPAFIRHPWTSWTAQHMSDGCILISTELQRRYGRRRPSIRVPALVDVSEFSPPSRSHPARTLTLLYSGNPSNKDQLGTLMDILIADTESDPSLRPVQLRLAGPDPRTLAANPDVGPRRVKGFGDVVVPLGRLSRDELKEELHRADFTVLFRPDRGYARSGFPSKVPESLAAGTPVLANMSSDLGLYLEDGTNAVICQSDPITGEVDAAQLARRLVELRAKTDDELVAMRIAARHSAEALSVSAWSREFAMWLKSL